MSKNKQKTFLIGYGVVTGLGALGLTYMAMSAGSERDAKAEAVTGMAKKIKDLKNADVFPKPEFLASIKTKSTEVIAAAQKLHDSVSKIQVPYVNTGLEGSGVSAKLTTYKD